MTNENNVRHPDGSFLTEQEIHDYILQQLSDDDKAHIREMNFDELIMLHHTTGRSIRNDFGLWDKDNRLVEHDHADHHYFPDQISQRIIENVWKSVCKEQMSD